MSLVPHTIPAKEVLAQLGVPSEAGLQDSEVQKRLTQYGSNALVEGKRKSLWVSLWEQLTEPLVMILIFAAVVSAFLGKVDSTIAILAIVIINAFLGLFQEYRAEQAMAALRKMTAPLVRVRRSGQVRDIEALQLVPGDIVLLDAGNIIPADGRLLEAASLQIQEASLTGESLPVEKITDPIDNPKLPLGDRRNMMYMGTSVTHGRGVAVVTSTGMQTELGHIATLIQGVEDEKTPLQKRMDEVGKVLLGVAVLVMALATVIGLSNGHDLEYVLVEAVAIAVAVVPEGLPAVVTISLALGAQRMLHQRALIRRLPAVETLGSVTVICSDKTGTLTENRMSVTIIDVAGHNLDLPVVDTHTAIKMGQNGDKLKPENPAQEILLLAGILCNDAVLQAQDTNEYMVIGDPTEGALVVAGARYGMLKPILDEQFTRVGEVPFSSERKRMTTVHEIHGGIRLPFMPLAKARQIAY
jgi:P-type Ca2+ transporter type 2C